MRHVLHLEPYPWARSDTTLDFEWDEGTGELTGRDAEAVRARAAEALKRGYVPIEPIPATIEIRAPLIDRTEFAALLGGEYVLPAFLAAVYPRVKRAPAGDGAVY